MRGDGPLLLQPSQLEVEQLTLGDLPQHPDQLGLLELEARNRLAEDDPCLRVVERLVIDGHGRADGPPRDPVARLGQAGQGGLQPGRRRKDVFLGDFAILKDKLRGDRGPQRELPDVILGREASGSLLHEEAPDSLLRPCPEDGDIGDRAVRDPGLGAVDDPAVRLAHRPGFHPRRVRACVRLGQAEAADLLSPRHRGQPPLLLLVGAERVDRIHAQRPLHRDERAKPRIPPLQLLHDQPVSDRAEARAAVAFQVRPEKSHAGHLGDQFHRKGPGPEVVLDDGQHVLLDPLANGVPDEPLLLGQQARDIEEVNALESAHPIPLPPPPLLMGR